MIIKAIFAPKYVMQYKRKQGEQGFHKSIKETIQADKHFLIEATDEKGPSIFIGDEASERFNNDDLGTDQSSQIFMFVGTGRLDANLWEKIGKKSTHVIVHEGDVVAPLPQYSMEGSTVTEMFGENGALKKTIQQNEGSYNVFSGNLDTWNNDIIQATTNIMRGVENNKPSKQDISNIISNLDNYASWMILGNSKEAKKSLASITQPALNSLSEDVRKQISDLSEDSSSKQALENARIIMTAIMK